MRANTHTTTSHGTHAHHAALAPTASPRAAPPAAITSFQPGHLNPDPRGTPLKDTLQALTRRITSLRATPIATLDTLITLCQELKGAEDRLMHAQHDPRVAGERHQLCRALPLLFNALDTSLRRHHGPALDIAALESLCLGLATLVRPVPGPLLTPEYAQAAHNVLTSLSSQLAEQLTDRIEQQVTDPGPLLNCLNWFSRALKAELLPRHLPAVTTLFQAALTELQRWAENSHATSLNHHQLAKAMVQLNTMVKQQLIRIDTQTAAGQDNRARWANCVHHLCRHFLSTPQWLNECSGLELINVTNTLKDGLELGLLNGEDADLTTAFKLIALRIHDQAFTDAG